MCPRVPGPAPRPTRASAQIAPGEPVRPGISGLRARRGRDRGGGHPQDHLRVTLARRVDGATADGADQPHLDLRMADRNASGTSSGRRGMVILGIDVGGSGIKGAPVDVSTGMLTEERYRVETPQPSKVDGVVAAVTEVAKRFGAADRAGITFPGVVLNGVTKTAANVHRSWIDAPAAELFGGSLGLPATVLNDADAAGVAEMRFGAGRDQRGVAIMLTLGTGIGSAVFVDGR